METNAVNNISDFERLAVGDFKPFISNDNPHLSTHPYTAIPRAASDCGPQSRPFQLSLSQTNP